MTGADASAGATTARRPLTTYRLQIRESFTLQDAAAIVDYLDALGVDTVYLSPLLQAASGSDHGYDVVDHSRIDPTRGGAEGLARLSEAARARGMGVLVDIVPNHVGVADPAENPWWWDVLRAGRDSAHAAAFDIDWEAGDGRIRVPVLGEASDPPLTIDRSGDEPVLAYYDNRFPIAPGTADDGADAATVHDRQHYELVHWRREGAELNYRRFFGVSTLAAIKVEDEAVFDASHAEIRRWLDEGLVDGLRVDHPDGLTDPGGYLDRLARISPYVLVEKILEHGERLPPHWETAGTTGYEALADLDRVFVDPAGEAPLDRLDGELRHGSPADWAAMIHGTKRGIADGILESEVNRLARIAVAHGLAEHDAAADAVAELLACFPVYRSYLPYGGEHLHDAVQQAVAHRPELDGAIRALLPALSDPDHPLAIRFQQTSGMVMAKGVEDTAFYRYTRLTSLTEVGADPSEFAITVDEFHRRQADRQSSLPATMTTLSTHDTKRGEDVRARITALAEQPALWADALARLRALAPLGDGPLENLLWQAVVGSYPASRERLHAYAEKASREAGDSTAWLDVDEAFEERMHALVDAVFDDPGVRAVIDEVVAAVSAPGRVVALGQKLLQLTGPGVPDVYQGSELVEDSLVDPDNRREVDFAARRAVLARLEGGELPEVDGTGAAKLLVTRAALHERRRHPERFGAYRPLAAVGDAADHLVAVDRGGAIALATRLPAGLAGRGGWGDTAVLVPGRRWRDAVGGAVVEGPEIRVADLLSRYPVALLVPADRDPADEDPTEAVSASAAPASAAPASANPVEEPAS